MLICKSHVALKSVHLYGIYVVETKIRRSQEDRRATTRARVLDAVVASLIERGYAATTIAAVQERADVARGTLLHHFPTRTELMTAAVEHVAERRLAEFRNQAVAAPAGLDRLDAVVDIAWRDLNGPTFFAMLELWVAARTDEDLRSALEPVERKIFAVVYETVFGVEGLPTADPRLPTLVQFTIDLLTGLSMSSILSANIGPREVVLRRWKRAMRVLMGELDADRLVEGQRVK